MSHSVNSAGSVNHETTLAWKEGHLLLVNMKMACMVVAALVKARLSGAAYSILPSDAGVLER